MDTQTQILNLMWGEDGLILDISAFGEQFFGAVIGYAISILGATAVAYFGLRTFLSMTRFWGGSVSDTISNYRHRYD